MNSQFVIKYFEDCINDNHSSKVIPLHLLIYDDILPTTTYSYLKDERHILLPYTPTGK